MSLLLDEVHRLVCLLPPEILCEVVKLLSEETVSYNEALETRILSTVTNPHLRRSVQTLLHVWRDDRLSRWNARELSVALTSAQNTLATGRRELSVDLAWTGPGNSNLPIRRTDQVLLEMIRECKQELTIISFAIYKVPLIVTALSDALARGVKLQIVAEMPESEGGKIPFGMRATFGADIIDRSKVLIWPKDKRPTDAEGNYGSLHIKGAASDRKKLFITSANLTGFALSLNMELGVLIESKQLTKVVIDQILSLEREGYLVQHPG